MRANIARWTVARGRAAALLLGLVATTACTTATPTRYKTLTEGWRRSEAAARATDVGDRLFEGAPFLERQELIRQVLERNPTLRAARYAWRAALERYPQVTALDDPLLGAGVAPRSIGSSRANDAPKFDLSQKLPFPGKLRLRGEAVLAEAEAASHDFASVRLRLATLASLLFDDHYLAARSLEINAEHIALLEEFQRIATVRYEAGKASQQDPIQAEVELTHALHREILLQTAQRVTAEQINTLLHRPPSRTLPPAPPRAPVPRSAADPADQLIEQALEERPELAAAAARVAAEEARVDLAWRDYFPDFTLTGSYNRLWQEEDLQPFVGIQLNVPLQLGRRRAALEEARARLEQARSQRRAIEDEVRFGVQSGADRLAEAHHVMRLFADRLLPAARDQVAAARSGFETGRNSFLVLIDAERNLRNVELGYEEALANLTRRRAELDQTLGRIPGLTW
ncbi:MAG: TolC family protein [Myxococcota bacterium]